VRRWIVLAATLLASAAFADARLTGLVAQDLLKKSEAGDAKAQFLLATAYDTGSGAPRNAVQAERWYKAAAAQGHVEAHNSLGRLYVTQKKAAEARAWFEKGAALGHPQATSNLALVYDVGFGVPRDRRKALAIYATAADLGSAYAMWNIAHIHIAGQLEKPDLVGACVWVIRARRFAPRTETQLRSEISRAMTRLEAELPPEGLARCNEEGARWKPANPVPGSADEGSGGIIRPDRDWRPEDPLIRPE
jgi:TPR repeat protein